jgi:hypothetical protein
MAAVPEPSRAEKLFVYAPVKESEIG